MKKNYLYTSTTVVLVLLLLQLDFIVAQPHQQQQQQLVKVDDPANPRKNEIVENNFIRNRNDVTNGNGRGRGWVQTAQQMLGGPTGQIMVNVAKELINRSAGNSQVLSLNLTNLLILILLKGLIFAAGLIGAGNWSHYARGRGLENPPLLEASETPLLIGFLAAQGSHQDGCLQRAACNQPETASEYLRAARAILKGSEIFDQKIQVNPRYNQLVYMLEQATVEGMEGAPCDMIYSCLI